MLNLLFVSSKVQVPIYDVRFYDNKTSMNYVRVLQLSYRRPFLETLKRNNETDITKIHLSSFLRSLSTTAEVQHIPSPNPQTNASSQR